MPALRTPHSALRTPAFAPLGGNLYRRGEHLYGRFTLATGRRAWKKLAAITIRHAREEIAELTSQHRQAAAGLTVAGQPAVDPFSSNPNRNPAPNLARLLAQWRSLDCPDLRNTARAAEYLRAIDLHLPRLTEHLGHLAPERLTVADCNRYADTRLAAYPAKSSSTPRFTGRRSIALELTTLRNCLSWAASRGHIRHNPIAGQLIRVQSGKEVRHARECMPASGDQFHALANWLFSSERSEVFGWMVLVAGVTGCRIGELRALRWDARRHNESHIEPGYISADSLYVLDEKNRRRSNAAGLAVRRIPLVDHELPATCPSRDILPGLLAQLRRWRDARHPESNWYFPGRFGHLPTSSEALNHALADACRALQIQHITPHGLRAYYTTVMRRWRVADSLIASRLGQVSGESLIQRVYGQDIGAIDPCMDWLPATEPIAWLAFDDELPADPGKILTLKTA